jgi:hypothetical protein
MWLKEPDEVITNPMYRSSPPSKLYLITRVKRQEKNKRFIEWFSKNKVKREKMSKSMLEVSRKKRDDLIEYI